ncbi:dihydrolipoyl dehydrogenase, mitochondrial [Raphidocelis subcapitata]|uniref:Dihydrolipoyl dehydrogenase n=1 Tax=Raphidocelis subcapitata TaxID=307507 RepID=A0A2V0NYQ4_9CHLO|nr:dihydrolipoyl dehydrogenase, mitochondrial [Raphidocelis subcapitata]|eukprot:GBF90057.1 dihydrolipoyl dehydrogenase, mitochondrial [Raphidocelis subcapitata]
MLRQTVRRQQPLLLAHLRSTLGLRGFATGEEQDLVIIGGGPGGYVAAIKAGQMGLKVACVEGRGSLGGTCLNVGCIPSKALLNSSHAYAEAKDHMKAMGVTFTGLSYDWGTMQKGKDETVSGLTKGIEGLFKKNKVEYVKGWGTLKGPNTVEVALADGSSRSLSAKNIMIATGSEVTPLPGVPVDEERIVTSTGALKLKEVPGTMVVIGGGYIGLEMGSVYQRLGSKVTVVEFMDNIVPTMDGEIRRQFQRSLQKQGMTFKLGTKVNSARREGDKVLLEVEPAKGGAKETIEVDVVLVSAGRRPFTEGLGLDAVGIPTDKRGRIEVDDHFRTKVPSIYAIGDVIPGPMLAHKAEEDGVAAVEIICGKAGHVNYNTVPSIVYTHPEVASVGLTEEEAKAKGLNVKLIADAKTDKLLGAWIMGPNAGELIPECVLAMEYGACTEDIARSCHGHPTLSEAIKEAALATAFGKPIHM